MRAYQNPRGKRLDRQTRGKDAAQRENVAPKQTAGVGPSSIYLCRLDLTERIAHAVSNGHWSRSPGRAEVAASNPLGETSKLKKFLENPSPIQYIGSLPVFAEGTCTLFSREARRKRGSWPREEVRRGETGAARAEMFRHGSRKKELPSRAIVSGLQIVQFSSSEFFGVFVLPVRFSLSLPRRPRLPALCSPLYWSPTLVQPQDVRSISPRHSFRDL